MPISKEILERLRGRIEEAEKMMEDLKGTIASLRRSGIDISSQEERLRELRSQWEKMKMVYGSEMKRWEEQGE
jgi:predicted  nucleic acid-binding Zn-ribbon protein